jgi:GDP-L-fucose synthase
MYGPGDNYDLKGSHVLPAMIRKLHEAKITRSEVTLWGDGSPYREFLHVDDCAQACVMLMEKYDYSDLGEFINLGSGSELTIRELAGEVAKAVGYKGEIRWDRTKPNGTPRKFMDSSRLFALGWRPRIGLEEGLAISYADFQSRYGDQARKE